MSSHLVVWMLLFRSSFLHCFQSWAAAVSLQGLRWSDRLWELLKTPCEGQIYAGKVAQDKALAMGEIHWTPQHIRLTPSSCSRLETHRPCSPKSATLKLLCKAEVTHKPFRGKKLLQQPPAFIPPSLFATAAPKWLDHAFLSVSCLLH